MNKNLLRAAIVTAAAHVCALPAIAGQTITENNVLTCVTDKWDEKEPEKGHKFVDFAGRCIEVPEDRSAEMFTEDCTGKYEYKPDGTWKGSGSCVRKLKGGDQITDTWEEGSHLKEYTFTVVSGTGKYNGVKGGGTYLTENLTETLAAGRLKGKLELP